MSVWKICKEHGIYHAEHVTCPLCKEEKDKRSKKYGGVSIHIPPNMRSVK
jgi:hypothetical protein